MGCTYVFPTPNLSLSICSLLPRCRSFRYPLMPSSVICNAPQSMPCQQVGTSYVCLVRTHLCVGLRKHLPVCRGSDPSPGGCGAADLQRLLRFSRRARLFLALETVPKTISLDVSSPERSRPRHFGHRHCVYTRINIGIRLTPLIESKKGGRVDAGIETAD